MKRCSRCEMAKKLTAFSKRKIKDGTYDHASACKICLSEDKKKRYQQYTSEQRAAKKSKFLMRNYGITIAQYENIKILQKACCASCGKSQSTMSKALVVDHCHNSKRVRGLLCSGCNLALGNIAENVESLLDLALYLEATKNTDLRNLPVLEQRSE